MVLPKKMCNMKDIFLVFFLDTQVSLAPTHVSKLVSWLVTLSIFEIQKTQYISF